MGQKDKRINEEIRSYTVNVIGVDGEKLGVMPTAKALQLAADANVDLVEIGGMNEGVTIAKIMDYGKFLFKQQKNISKSKSNSKRNEIKTLRLTYKMGDHDLEVRRNQAIKFAKEGHPLKINLMLRGRENHFEKAAIEKIEQFINSLTDIYKLEGKIIKTGTVFNVMLSLKK
ncbi:translation initiation factor IF-3 [Candidatus Gracilibacteria bacterium]|nr:translation initiation factor IF-3 [Candidatus Gracilibacteria bacterium]